MDIYFCMLNYDKWNLLMCMTVVRKTVHHHIYDLVEDTDLLGSGHAQLHPCLFDFTSWRPVVFIFSQLANKWSQCALVKTHFTSKVKLEVKVSPVLGLAGEVML